MHVMSNSLVLDGRAELLRPVVIGHDAGAVHGSADRRLPGQCDGPAEEVDTRARREASCPLSSDGSVQGVRAMKRDFNLSMGSRRPWLPGFGEDNVGEWVRAGLLSVDHAIGIVAQQPPIPLPSDSYKFLRWPWSRRAGMSFLVKEYHFLAELADRDLNQYEVSITPETSSRVVLCAVMEELARLHMASYLGGRIWSYDGGKAMYTVGALPFTSKEFLLDEDDGSS